MSKLIIKISSYFKENKLLLCESFLPLLLQPQSLQYDSDFVFVFLYASINTTVNAPTYNASGIDKSKE
jgi:hypothetical protein